MQLEVGNLCPLLNKPCAELKCAWFTKLTGSHPQTGQSIDEWGCAIAWTPVLLVENTQASNATGAAIESFRNEVVNPKQSKLDHSRVLEHGSKKTTQ